MTRTHCPAVAVPEVAPCDPAELAPLAAWLGRGETAPAALRFPRGTVLPDGRLTRPREQRGRGARYSG